MKTLNSPILAIACLAAFVWLAVHSLDRQGTTSNEDINAFIQKQLEEYKSPYPITQQQAMYEVWGLTQEDAAKPVYLFGKDGERI